MTAGDHGARRRSRGRRRRLLHPRDRPLPLEILRRRLARLMIERYGVDAVTQAAMQGNILLAKGDVKGLKARLMVIVTIERLQAPVPADGQALH